jgi:hypothetical protein
MSSLPPKGSGAKFTIPSPETLGDRQENRINRALQYEHFRLNLFEIESLHQNRGIQVRGLDGGGIDGVEQRGAGLFEIRWP